MPFPSANNSDTLASGTSQSDFADAGTDRINMLLNATTTNGTCPPTLNANCEPLPTRVVWPNGTESVLKTETDSVVPGNW